MEGHLFHVYSHVYTLNNLYADNMTVRCLHTPFQHIQQEPELKQWRIFWLNLCVLPVCMFNCAIGYASLCVQYLCILVLVVFWQSVWLKEKRFSQISVWDSSIIPPLAYLTPHSYVCELSVCPPYSGIWWLLCVMSPLQAYWLPSRGSVLFCDCWRWTYV